MRQPSRRLTLLVATLLAVVELTWALATPLFSSPDEQTHLVKGVALVHGDVLGQPSTQPSYRAPAYREVTVPRWVAQADPHCFAHRPGQPASCATTMTHDPTPIQDVTYVGRYPPLYYALVAWPALLLSGPEAVYAIRFCSGLATALMLTLAFLSFRRLAATGAAPLLGLALLLSVTPMLLFMGAMLQPSGLECSAALAAWAGALALARGAGPPSRAAWLGFLVPALVLPAIRALSPLFLLVIVVTAGLLASRARLRELWAERQVRLGSVALGLVVAASVGYVAVARSLTLAGYHGYTGPGGTALLGRAWRRLPELGREAVGVFGNLDAQQAQAAVIGWAAAVLLLVVAGLLQRWTRAQVLAVLFTVGVPLLMYAVLVKQARHLGFVAQTRYYLPLALGVPALAAVAGRGRGAAGRLVRRLVVPLAVGVLAVHVLAFLFALRRNRTGVHASLWVAHAPWEPPVPAASLVAVFTVALAGLVVLVVASFRRPV